MNSMYRSSQPEQGFSTKPNWTGGLWTALSLWGEYEHGTKAITWLLDSKNKIAHHQKATTKIDVCDGYFFKILKNWNRSLHLIWLKKNLWRSRKKETKSGKTGRWMGDGSKKKKEMLMWGVDAGFVCVYVRGEEKERGSGAPPAAVCRLGVHGGWAEWKAQPTRREHLARHQLCTGHARHPASTAQTHKHWRSKQRQTNTWRTHRQHVGGWREGQSSSAAVPAAGASSCSAIFTGRGGKTI